MSRPLNIALTHPGAMERCWNLFDDENWTILRPVLNTNQPFIMPVFI